MKDVTDVIDMTQYMESQCKETVMIGTSESTKSIHIQYLCKHARTMCMMYEATGEQRYLEQARHDLDLARTIQVGFLRPLGVHKKEVA
jgi:hypothetical protein